MQCPGCKNERLGPTQLDDGLVALACGSCAGVLLSLLVYRGWQETHGLDATGDETDVRVEADGESARLCPKCARFMTKYGIHANTPNRLDLCTHCDEVWLDAGEWALLRHLALLPELPRVFTDAWQHRIRREHQHESSEQRLRDQLGPADYERSREFASWLKVHPARARIMAWVANRIRSDS